VQTRRDRDGFAIVKVKAKIEYKYKLDDIINYSPEEDKKLVRETQELILKAFLGDKPDAKSIEELILPKEGEYEMDLNSKRAA